jgi:hypothetical protein
MMRWARGSDVVVIGIVVLSGCGPLMVPAGVRIEPAAQAQLDVAWEQAMAFPHKLNREELLEFVVGDMAHVVGVDRFRFRSEKDLSGGTVVMTVEFDRAVPGQGQFTVEYRSRAGEVLRAEHYSGDEVVQRAAELARSGETEHREIELEPDPAAEPPC